jgi:hypothetical protein
LQEKGRRIKRINLAPGEAAYDLPRPFGGAIAEDGDEKQQTALPKIVEADVR